MNKAILFFLLMVCTLSASAQVWDQLPQSLVQNTVMLDQNFVATNGIGLVEKLHQRKAPNQPIISLGMKEQFYFDEDGQLIKTMEIDRYGYVMKEVTYSYTDQLLNCVTTTTGNRVVEKRNLYDDGRLSGEVWRAWSKSNDGDTTTIKAMQIDHKTWNDSTEVFHYNHADGRPIYRLKLTRSSSNYLLSVDTKYHMGGKSERTAFEYDISGQVSRTTQYDRGDISVDKHFTYNGFGLLESVDMTVPDGETQYEYVYDDAMLPKAVLFKEGDIVVIKKYVVTLLKDMPLTPSIAEQ